MYVSGHILTSVLLARATAKSLKLGFGTAAAVMITASLIDADHLFNYGLDDGTISSFGLHPLHIYWYLTLATLLISAIIFRKARPYLFAALLGLGLHYTMDILADAVHYNLYWLIAIDVACYAVAILVVRRTTKSVLFLTLALVVPYAVNGFLLYVLNIAVDASPAYHYVTIIMLSVAVLLTRKTLK